MHPTIEAIQRARDVDPRMVGWNGQWTRELEQMEREYLETIQRQDVEIKGLLQALVDATVKATVIKKGKA